MPINVPQNIFDKYNEVIDSTFDIFGVTCQLVSIEKQEIITPYDPDDNLPDINTINDHRRNNRDRNRGTKTIKEVEVLTDIKLKVYWDFKQFIKTGSDIAIPDGSIQTISMFTDVPNLMKAKQLIVHKDIKGYREYRFIRHGDPIPMGLKQNRYAACFWKRA